MSKQKVIIAGIRLKGNEREFASMMEETKSLCEACHMEVVSEMVQTSRSIDPRTGFRSGKVEELRDVVQQLHADLVIFQNQMSVIASERIAEIVGCEVIDRTALILKIFSERARTRQAKLQTELARLQYALPQVTASMDDHERERGGGVTNRGQGEMRSAVIAKKYRSRMNDIKKELAHIESQRQMDERRRAKTLYRRVALVGYTNAGKSSFMNAVLSEGSFVGSRVEEKDMLFATLDTSVRMVGYENYRFLLYDTVGFVSNLPHTLVESFHSTLASAKEADLLVEIVDISDENWQRKADVTEETLQEIGAGDIPRIRIFNKCDKLEEEHPEGGIYVSCLTHAGIHEVCEIIISHLYRGQHSTHCILPYDKIGLIDRYKPVLSIQILSQDERGMELLVSGKEEYIGVFDPYMIKGGN